MKLDVGVGGAWGEVWRLILDIVVEICFDC